ncbi:hypothetical protein FRC07_012009 [Ceratobasidium sp. 392]|nr:hypothetical protein FRC07_012009 [Ceratobasidium sp. 392]
MFTLREINQMEREMCGYLEWVINVKPEHLRDLEAMVRKEYGPASAAPASVAVPIPRRPAEPRKQLAADYASGNPHLLRPPTPTRPRPRPRRAKRHPLEVLDRHPRIKRTHPVTRKPVADTKPTKDVPQHRESCQLRERSAAPVLVALPAHPHAESPTTAAADQARSRAAGGGSATPLHFSTKHYPASAHGKGGGATTNGCCAGHTHFPLLPPDHAPGPLPNSASASFSYRGPPQPSGSSAAPPVPPPLGSTPLVLDREPPAPIAPEFNYMDGLSQQAVLANMLSQRIDQVDQLCTQLAHTEAHIASLSARFNPLAVLTQAKACVEATEARLAAIKDDWRGVESYLDMLSRREAEAWAAFACTLGTGKVGVPSIIPVFGAGAGGGSTSPYLPRPPVLPNVPNRVWPNTFPTLPLAPVVGGVSVVWLASPLQLVPNTN